MRKAIRRMITRIAPAGQPGSRVLLYHSIDTPLADDPLRLRVAPEAFRRQMRLLKERGYDVVPLQQLAGEACEPQSACIAITFDDGCVSQRAAAETLLEFGFPATFFLVPSFLDGAPPRAYWEQWGHIDWDGAAWLLEQGFEIGAHSRTHRDLTACSDEELSQEIAGGKTVLEQRLSCEISGFSYPFGRYDQRVRDAVAHAGFRYACTSRYGRNDLGHDSLRLSRCEIPGGADDADFLAILDGKADWFGYWQDLSWGRRKLAGRRFPAKTASSAA